ncbi:polyhydroxybutyrate depolymerase [Streptomyces sp. TRM66268-LWL]|uniref:Polyhydroxybutyrate depolymerase n=1 Tax=Streptomyces polyasparticus TaxID=2767826 RepID=A0ABR7SV93_9ACTN|nr:PHB depolymerase family esterase [Streptomyces polyasparticus]MBC9718273.1 polyhydroxybutyrate depolymerase [Streptomyces polyasparticus]
MPPKGLRRILAAVLLALALALAGCSSGSGEGKGEKPKKPSKSASPQASPGPGDQTVTLDWKGTKRTYAVHAPPSYAPGRKLPLVIVMHPYPSTGTHVAKLSDFSAKADKENFLAVYPEGVNGGMNALVCCGSEDDVGFLRTITKSLVDTWGADPQRIYATGISNGGDMSFKLAVELSDTFAAIAPVSGGYSGRITDPDTYVPKSPVSVITFIGGDDKWYPVFNAGLTIWQERLKCKEGPPTKLKQKITRTAARCADGSELVAYRLPDMGHSWPQGKSDMAEREAAVNATDLIWDFFKSHPKKAT